MNQKSATDENVIIVFPNCVSRMQPDEKVILDLNGGRIIMHHNGQDIILDTLAMQPGTSALICSRNPGDFVLYNFKEILGLLGLKSLEFLRIFQLRGFVQVNKSRRGCFIKVFCLEGKKVPDSNYTHWEQFEKADRKDLHFIDKKYSCSFLHPQIRIIKNKKLKVSGLLWKPGLCKEDPVYFNHGGQTILLQEGMNHFEMPYVPGEDAYIGQQYCRNVGHRIEIRGES